MDWIHLTQGRDKLWAVVNTVMNFDLHKMGEGAVDFLCSWRNCKCLKEDSAPLS